MSLHDITTNIAVEQVLAPQTIQGSALNSGNIDCRASGAVAVAVMIGNIVDTLGASNRIDLKIEHADDDGTGAPGAYGNCTDEDVLNFTGLSSGIFMAASVSCASRRRPSLLRRAVRSP